MILFGPTSPEPLKCLPPTPFFLFQEALLEVPWARTKHHPLVIVLGMPKSGTGTIHEFFRCNHWPSAHWRCRNSYCGDCVTRWVVEMSKGETKDGIEVLLETCGSYDVFAQIDEEPAHACLFPQVFYLQTLLHYLPHACFILNRQHAADRPLAEQR